jgi:hypothetical protein
VRSQKEREAFGTSIPETEAAAVEFAWIDDQNLSALDAVGLRITNNFNCARKAHYDAVLAMGMRQAIVIVNGIVEVMETKRKIGR